MDPTGFANPWEHVRLLSDGARNEALLTLLARHAPGARVVEVGCGAGLLACAAARLGAQKVYAVEPTALADVAERLVRDNALSGTVEILRGRIEALPSRPVDLAFSELLNADPFVEGVLSAMDAAATWVVPGGRLAPRRLRVWAALARAPGSDAESRAAGAQLRTFAERYDLRLDALRPVLAPTRPYTSLSSSEAAIGAPTLVWDLPLGVGAVPVPTLRQLVAAEPGPVAGVLTWFEAELDDDLTLANPPGAAGHWGVHLSAFAPARGVRGGESVPVEFSIQAGRLRVLL